MILAYTLIRVKTNRNVETLNKILKTGLVKEAVLVYGEYDLIVETETKSLDDLDSIIYSSLRTIPEITKTTTLVVANIG